MTTNKFCLWICDHQGFTMPNTSHDVAATSRLRQPPQPHRDWDRISTIGLHLAETQPWPQSQLKTLGITYCGLWWYVNVLYGFLIIEKLIHIINIRRHIYIYWHLHIKFFYKQNNCINGSTRGTTTQYITNFTNQKWNL